MNVNSPTAVTEDNVNTSGGPDVVGVATNVLMGIEKKENSMVY